MAFQSPRLHRLFREMQHRCKAPQNVLWMIRRLISIGMWVSGNQPTEFSFLGYTSFKALGPVLGSFNNSGEQNLKILCVRAEIKRA